MHKIFIDDIGSKDYINEYDYNKKCSLPEWNNENLRWLDNNFFSLCGIHLKISDIEIIDKEIKNLKIKFFGTNKVEIKSTYLRNPKNRKKYYIIPYGITNEELSNFGEEIYKILEKYKNKFIIFGVVFDKRQYKYRNSDNSNILVKSTQALFEGINKSGFKTKVVFDQIENSLVKTKGNNGKILEIFQGENKNIVKYDENFGNIEDIEFQKSENENMLQIADLISYNVRRQFMQHGKVMIEDGGNSCDYYTYFKKIGKNIYKCPNSGKIIGYGLVLFPNRNKYDWRF